VVEAGVQRIRMKTVKALIDHIIQTLPVADSYCSPISLDYLKCLRVILEYQPHVEHLRDKWQAVVEFCLDGVSMLQGGSSEDQGSNLPAVSVDLDDHEQPATPGATFRSTLLSPNASARASSRAGTPGLVSAPGPKTPRSSRSPMEVEELILCIHQLVRAPNAPLQTLSLAEPILEALIGFLQTVKSIGRAHYDALAALNLILAQIIHEHTELAERTIRQLLPIFKDFWSPKSTHFRDEIVITLVLTQSYIAKLLPESLKQHDSFAFSVEGLLDLLVSDYAKRHEREQLQLEDLLLDPTSYGREPGCLRTEAFQLSLNGVRGEISWSVLHLVAKLSCVCDSVRNAGSAQCEVEAGARKKPRLSTYYDGYLKQASMASGPSQVAALQLLSFIFQFHPLNSSKIEDAIERLSNLINDSNTTVASWAMLALTR
jgi:serine-protein kinase ATM